MTTITESQIEDALERLFERVARMPDSELLMLRSAWEDGDAGARQRAWRSVKQVTASRERQRLLDDARDRLTAWVNNYLTATAIEYGNFVINAGSGMDAGTVRREALPPLLDAIAGTVGADLLSDDDRSALLGPMASLERD